MRLTPDIVAEMCRLLCPLCAAWQQPRLREDSNEMVHDMKHGNVVSHTLCRASGLLRFAAASDDLWVESVEFLYPIVCRGCREHEPARPRPDACPDWLHEVPYMNTVKQSRCMASGLRNSRFAAEAVE